MTYYSQFIQVLHTVFCPKNPAIIRWYPVSVSNNTNISTCLRYIGLQGSLSQPL